MSLTASQTSAGLSSEAHLKGSCISHGIWHLNQIDAASDAAIKKLKVLRSSASVDTNGTAVETIEEAKMRHHNRLGSTVLWQAS